jgi:hypothetical protein
LVYCWLEKNDLNQRIKRGKNTYKDEHITGLLRAYLAILEGMKKGHMPLNLAQNHG